MTWFHWVLIALFALRGIVVISTIGNTREPWTKSDAVASVIICGLLIWGVVEMTR